MLDMIEDLLFKLSRVPGLGFLDSYVLQIREKRGRHEQYVGDLKAQRDNAKQGAKALRDSPKSLKGSKKKR